MANLSDLSLVVSDLFGVIGTLITEMVTLMTGDLLILAIVGAFVGLIIGVITLLFKYMKNQFSSSTKMR